MFNHRRSIWHASFWKTTGDFERSFDGKSRRAVGKPPGHRSLKTASLDPGYFREVPEPLFAAFSASYAFLQNSCCKVATHFPPVPINMA
jgi:hypothetical protein